MNKESRLCRIPPTAMKLLKQKETPNSNPSYVTRWRDADLFASRWRSERNMKSPVNHKPVSVSTDPQGKTARVFTCFQDEFLPSNVGITFRWKKQAVHYESISLFHQTLKPFHRIAHLNVCLFMPNSKLNPSDKTSVFSPVKQSEESLRHLLLAK